MQCTAALAELRRNDAGAALRRLDARVFPRFDYPNRRAMADIVRALAYQNTGRPGEARVAFGRARADVEAHRRWPDVGARAYDWHNWLQVEILIREVDGLIPDATEPSADPTTRRSLASEQAARRERKARAARADTRTALAWIARDAGRIDEARAELKRVLDERAKIAAEEPDNPDYQAALAATQLQLARAPAKMGDIHLIPTATATWRYTTDRPADDWTRPDFDDSRWKQGSAAFGVGLKGPLSILTNWNTLDIWIRRAVEVPPSARVSGGRLVVFHEEDLEVYLNGVAAARLEGWGMEYQEASISKKALATLQPCARVVVAAHCRNTSDPGGVDLGLIVSVSDANVVPELLAALRHAAAKLNPAAAARQGLLREMAMACWEATIATVAMEPDGRIAAELGEVADILDTTIAATPKPTADDWLGLAAVRGRLGDRDRAQAAAKRAIAAGIRPDPYRSLDRKAIALAATLGLDDPVAAEVAATAAGKPPASMNTAVAPPADRTSVLVAHADWCAKHLLLKNAVDDLLEADRSRPAPLNLFRAAIAAAGAGDMDRYRAACRTMFDRYERTQDALDAERAAKVCLLSPDSGIAPDRLAGLIRVLSAAPPSPSPAEWYPFTSALHAYRLGRYDDAMTALKESRRRNEALPEGVYRPLAAAILELEAMIQFRQGHAEDARHSLAEARRIVLDRAFTEGIIGAWHDWVVVAILDREARALLDPPAGAPR
ncbi:MAG: tetratricopeptide repeat protein [Isosphaeraceae bacterium]